MKIEYGTKAGELPTGHVFCKEVVNSDRSTWECFEFDVVHPEKGVLKDEKGRKIGYRYLIFPRKLVRCAPPPHGGRCASCPKEDLGHWFELRAFPISGSLPSGRWEPEWTYHRTRDLAVASGERRRSAHHKRALRALDEAPQKQAIRRFLAESKTRIPSGTPLH